MAIDRYAMNLIHPKLKDADVLSLSYPDILLNPEQAEQLFGFKPFIFLKSGQKRHGKDFKLPETEHLLKGYCKSFKCVDVEKFRGPEEIVDLNYPVDLGRFDLVIDPGTLEHCFNFAQAMMNAVNALKVGGSIIHMSPVTMINHGFYNLCPTLYHDFYTQNGFQIETFQLHSRRGQDEFCADIKGRETARCRIDPESGVIVMAKRLSDKALVYPTQTKYLKMERAA